MANFELPTVDEWYKAAYYDPAGTYFDYPTGSDTAPTAVTSGTVDDTAVYDQLPSQGPADIMLAGGLSPFGTMGQGGNVSEWMETEADLVNDDGWSHRVLRGGYWSFNYTNFLSSKRGSNSPANESLMAVGFRVASLSETAVVPEPTTFVLVLTGLAGLGWRKRKRLRK